ncbi:MAG: amidohydrolase [Omnitrophica WOR_2 bacterium]
MKIIHHARIYTLDPHHPSASAMAIQGDRVVSIGSDQEIQASFSAKAKDGESIDAGGKAIIPGLIDAHIHLQWYALGLQKVDCETPSRAECLQRVAERAQITPPGEWVIGHGWNQNEWAEGFGTADDLDRAAPLHPVYLTAKSLHAAWANHSALIKGGITPETADPAGGRIGRNEDGSLNGILFESAMDLIDQALPQPEPGQIRRAIQDAQPILWRMGLTGIHDYDGRDCFSALQALHLENKLHLRVVKGVPLDLLPHAVALGLRSGFGDDMLRIGSVKAFADGALGPQTAAMIQPYENSPDNRGMLLMDAEELYEHGRLAVQNGLSMAVHAIGDRANHEVLNGFAQLRELERGENGGKPRLRHRIEHVQLLHPGDLGRLAELGVIASMQPIHATSDMIGADRHWGKRAAYSYAWRSQLEHGATLAFGSDAPVESPNPFWGIHAAVTRRRLDGSPGPEGWYPEQRLTVMEAIQAYTTGAAYAAGMEDRLGKLAPGFLADLLWLDHDPFQCPADELRDIQPLRTMINGQWV